MINEYSLKFKRKQHTIKILNFYADDIVSGDKRFEIRKNDRAYQRGDTVKFLCVDDNGNVKPHNIDEREYVITYVLNGWGLENGYVVFGFQELSKHEGDSYVSRNSLIERFGEYITYDSFDLHKEEPLIVALFIKKKFFKRAVKEAIEDTQGAGKKDENKTACAVVQPQNESASALSYRAEDLRDSDVF